MQEIYRFFFLFLLLRYLIKKYELKFETHLLRHIGVDNNESKFSQFISDCVKYVCFPSCLLQSIAFKNIFSSNWTRSCSRIYVINTESISTQTVGDSQLAHTLNNIARPRGFIKFPISRLHKNNPFPTVLTPLPYAWSDALYIYIYIVRFGLKRNFIK